ncbi:rRNA maturation RNase YbeY [Antarcticimicrobium luteum]|uniref:Endoribonuclease YbeY n=1 Tax=Antarcticimicrobium luteum TaxID=2547397 RepID=A0A4R5VE47_9RHOB|nr:rRNA maturation RNase YbeY [Antarcticimicrobium luteum]TDK50598.1 rRNA maturation RNase YbeY [Antarcticimicrobium luteum]
MTIDLTLEDPAWRALDLDSLANRAAWATLTHLGLDPEVCEIALLACDDDRIADLNAEFRDKPGPTNVLSWPAEDLAAETPGASPDLPEPDFTGEIALGDIAIAYGTCAREAEAQGKSLADHACHLIVHGLLHLLGYDHIRDPDATLMEALEVEILGRLGLDDPYRGQDGP